MAPTAAKERKKAPARKRDKELEAMAKEGITLGQANRKSIAEHLDDCVKTRDEFKLAQQVTDGKVDELLAQQTQQTKVLVTLEEIMPWLVQTYANKQSRDRMWSAVGDFLYGMARKNWDSISGKLIFIAVAGYMVYKGVAWPEVAKMLAP